MLTLTANSPLPHRRYPMALLIPAYFDRDVRVQSWNGSSNINAFSDIVCKRGLPNKQGSLEGANSRLFLLGKHV